MAVFVDRMCVRRDVSSSERVVVGPAEDTRTKNKAFGHGNLSLVACTTCLMFRLTILLNCRVLRIQYRMNVQFREFCVFVFTYYM